MKLISINTFLICLLFVTSFSGCASIFENKSKNSRFENQDFSNKPVNLNNEQDRQKFEEISSELEKNRNLWREKNIFNYDFEVQRLAEGVGGDFTLTFKVRNNETLPIKTDYPYPDRYEDINSIEELFDYSQQMLERGNSVSIAFNQEFGFPEHVGISGGGTSWVSIYIRKFQIIQ